MSSTDKQFKIRARAIIIHEGKLLVVKHKEIYDYYALPGGHLEWGEDIKACLSREIMEEFGVKPQIGRLLYVHNFTKNNTQDIEFFFEVTNDNDFLDTQKLKKTHGFEIFEIRWINKNENINILPEQIMQDLKSGEILSDKIKYITR